MNSAQLLKVTRDIEKKIYYNIYVLVTQDQELYFNRNDLF